MLNATFRQLRVFCEVAKSLSFARAAEVLHLTPPAVTMQVKELESQLGLPMFERQGRQVSLTTSGEYFLVYARRLLATLKEADDAMARFRGAESGLLSIGLVSTAKYFVPQLLARFHEEHPGVEVKLSVCQNRQQLVALLQSGEVDLAVMGRPPKELATRAEPFAAHPQVFVAAPNHPLASLDHVPLEALANQRFIAREIGSGTRKMMDDFLREHHLAPRVAMELPSNETIKQAVMAGMGVSFLSLHTLGLELRVGVLKLLDVEHTPLMRTWNLVRMQSKLLSPAAEAFRYFMLENAEPHLLKHDKDLLEPRHKG
ncbi:MAG: LysR family transcriptional regulator [Paucibacter sp.]|nr:LysR family transcriptional regulator [Roseateles sp.]